MHSSDSELAHVFALLKHRGQTRYNKNKSPLMDHVFRVAYLVKESGGSDTEIAAAWLHDIVEDTLVTIDQIALEFSDEIREIVDGLTDPPEFKDLTIVERKIRQAERVRLKSDSVKRIKIADQISNVYDVAFDPPVKWDHKRCLEYVEGAKLVVEGCRGISSYLDRKFDEVYAIAIKVHK